MLSPRSLTPFLLLAALLSGAPGCAPKVLPYQVSPPSADLKVEAKPVLAPEALGSEAALDAHDIAVQGWGERGWLAVGRLCRWAKGMGAAVDCPPPPPDS